MLPSQGGATFSKVCLGGSSPRGYPRHSGPESLGNTRLNTTKLASLINRFIHVDTHFTYSFITCLLSVHLGQRCLRSGNTVPYHTILYYREADAVADVLEPQV